MKTAGSLLISDTELEGLLSRYTRDITALDHTGSFDPVTGRDEELDWVTLVLLQRQRRNVLLLGGAGVGKTALFIGLAQWINAARVPPMLKGARVIELDMTMIGAGSQNRADLEGRLIPILKGVAERNVKRTQPPIIFCIDEIHQLMSGFKGSSFAGIADLMKPYLTSGSLSVIGATTREEYEDYLRPDPAIDRRFQRTLLKPPEADVMVNILLSLKPNFEKHYAMKIPDDLCKQIVRLADRYIRTRSNPDKSILALDVACAYALKNGMTDQLNLESVKIAIGADAGIDPKAVE